jgi:hypothetical protein
MGMKQTGVLLCVALLMISCASPIVRDAGLDKLAPTKTEQDLSAGIRAYEDGEYGSSAGLLQNALSAGLFLYSDKVAAHKYLARDPDLELALAESGHPLWAPVFKSLKHSATKS